MQYFTLQKEAFSFDPRDRQLILVSARLHAACVMFVRGESWHHQTAAAAVGCLEAERENRKEWEAHVITSSRGLRLSAHGYARRSTASSCVSRSTPALAHACYWWRLIELFLCILYQCCYRTEHRIC